MKIGEIVEIKLNCHNGYLNECMAGEKYIGIVVRIHETNYAGDVRWVAGGPRYPHVDCDYNFFKSEVIKVLGEIEDATTIGR